MLIIIIPLYLFVIGTMLFLIRRYTKGNMANLFKEPISLTIFSLMLIHGLLPPMQYMVGLYRYDEGYSLWSHIYSAYLALLFVGVMVLTYNMSFKKESLRNHFFLPISMSGKFCFLVFMVVPACLTAYKFFFIIKSFGFDAYMADRIGFTAQHGGLARLVSRWLYLSFIVAASGYFASRKRDKGMLLLMIGLGVVNAGYFGFTGNRNSLLLAFLTVMGAYFVTCGYKEISFKRLLFSKIGISIVVLFVGMAVIGEIRSFAVNRLLHRSPFYRLTQTLSEGFGNHENINWMVDHGFDLKYGKTYLAGFVVVYPRAFWPNKPVGAGPVMKNLVRPDSYAVGRSGISSLTTGMVNEAYMNGGLIGVAIMAALTGIQLKFLSRLRSKCIGAWSISLYTYTMTIYAYGMTYGEFLGIYARWITDLFPLLMGYLLFEHGRRHELAWQQEELMVPVYDYYSESETSYDECL